MSCLETLSRRVSQRMSMCQALPSWSWTVLKAPLVQAPSLSWPPPWAPSHCLQQPTLNPYQENSFYWLHNRARRSIKWHVVKNHETRLMYCYFQEIMCQWYANFQMLFFNKLTMYIFHVNSISTWGKFIILRKLEFFFLRERIVSMAESNTHVKKKCDWQVPRTQGMLKVHNFVTATVSSHFINTDIAIYSRK